MARAGVEKYVEHHGSMIDARHAARLLPIIAALHGQKESVFKYPLGAVLREIKADIDESRLVDWTQHEYGLMLEAEMKARTRSRR